jgi:hypothetical protein
MLLPARIARRTALLALVISAVAAASAAAAAFTPGNLVVYVAGTGTGSLVNTGNPVLLDEFTPVGVLQQSIGLTAAGASGPQPVLTSGTATSEGLIADSPNGEFLTATGYDTASGGSSLTGTTSAAVPRTVAVVSSTGAFDTSTLLSDFGSGNNIRGAVTTDGSSLWVDGPTGVAYTTKGATTSTALATQNARQIGITAG